MHYNIGDVEAWPATTKEYDDFSNINFPLKLDHYQEIKAKFHDDYFVNYMPLKKFRYVAIDQFQRKHFSNYICFDPISEQHKNELQHLDEDENGNANDLNQYKSD